MYIAIAILIFGLLITVHELGHFTAAKLCGVKVTEFAIGMGPALFKRQKGETLYALRVLPIGGYCAMEEDEESDDPRHFTNKAWWQRFIILFAGAAMNFVAGVIILMFIIPGSRYTVEPVITGFFPDCPYESADAFQVGDEIYKIDGHRVYFKFNIDMLLDRGGDTHDIEIRRGGEKILLENFELTKHEYPGESQKLFGFMFQQVNTSFSGVITGAWYGSLDMVRMVWMGLADIIAGNVGLNDLSGPVGIVSIINEAGETAETPQVAAQTIAFLASFIAINLGVMNLLPLPALDGGRILFLLVGAAVEKTTKRKLNPKYEGYIHAAGMILLLGLMAVVMFSDIYKLFT